MVAALGVSFVGRRLSEESLPGDTDRRR